MAMKTRFKKRIKIAPGVYVNIGSKGISSVSVGGKGTTINFGQRGVTTTQSVPGTGVSFSHTSGSPPQSPATPDVAQPHERPPSAARGYVIIAVLVIVAIVIALQA